MTNLGPLTSFTPSAGCLTAIYGYQYTETLPTPISSSITTTRHKWHSFGLSNTADCYPQSFAPVSTLFYSPAPQRCPSGWVSACGSMEPLTGSETRATCCPRGYSCVMADPTAELWLATVSCRSAAVWPSPTVVLTVPDMSNVESRVTTLTSIVVHAAAIYARWQSSDLGLASSSSMSTTAGPPSGPQSSGSASKPTQTSTEGSGRRDPSGTADNVGGLTVGARVGIGVGVGVTVLGMIAAAVLVWVKRRRESAARNAAAIPVRAEGGADGRDRGGWGDHEGKWQLDDTARAQAELHGTYSVSGSSNPTTAATPMQSARPQASEGQLSPRGLELPGDHGGREMPTLSNTHEMNGGTISRELP